MEQTRTNWMGRIRTLLGKVVKALIAQVRKRYQQLKSRYGPRYARVMVAAVFFTLFVPIPGTILLAVALIVVIAEIHRGMSQKSGVRKTIAKEFVMSMNCDVILQWDATPTELTTLGNALWRWCNRAAGATGIYQYLDNQALADLIAGKLPLSSQPRFGRAHCRFRDEASQDREATCASLCQEIPDKGVADILVDGISWRRTDRMPGFHHGPARAVAVTI